MGVYWGEINNRSYMNIAANNIGLDGDSISSFNPAHPGPRTVGQESLGWLTIEQELGYPRYMWFFGFADLDQYKRWMYDERLLQEFEKLGLMLCKYVVDEQYFRCSDHQAIFVKHLSPCVETRRPTDC